MGVGDARYTSTIEKLSYFSAMESEHKANNKNNNVFQEHFNISEWHRMAYYVDAHFTIS